MNRWCLFLLLYSVLLISCDSDSKKDSPINEDVEYYVKYELKTSSRYIYNTVDVTLTTPSGDIEMTVPRNWEATFGPFRKSGILRFSLTCFPSYAYNTSTYQGEISISVGDRPFVLKSTKTISNQPFEMEYYVSEADLK